MPIKLENVGIAVSDIDATIDFFTDLGLTVIGRDTISGEWADTAVGLDGNHAKIAMLQTPDGTTSYFVPNLYDVFAAQPEVLGDRNDLRRRVWYSRAQAYQTNWYWYALLHRLQPDLHGFAEW